jgi:hypothetical protein
VLAALTFEDGNRRLVQRDAKRVAVLGVPCLDLRNAPMEIRLLNARWAIMFVL